MNKYSFPAELYSLDTMPNGELDQCSAYTRKGYRCKNAVLGYQIGSNAEELVGYVDGWPAYRPLVTVNQEEYDKMIAGVCHIHLA